jgi:AAA domain
MTVTATGRLHDMPPSRRKPAAEVPRAWVELEDFTESQNWMVYADTGAGKTALIRQLPGKVGIISSENGTVVLKRILRNEGHLKEADRFRVWSVRKWADLEEAFIWVRDHPDAFNWVAVDTATSVQHRAMRAAMEAAVKRSPEKRDIDLPDKGEHQKMQNAMKRMITDFNEVPVNMLWLAQAMRRITPDGDEIVLPFIMGKDYEVAAWAAAQMHVFAYLDKRRRIITRGGKKVGVTERVLMFDTFDRDGISVWAKDRYMVLPKRHVISIGDEQAGTLTELIERVDADPDAVARANSERREAVDATSPDRHIVRDQQPHATGRRTTRKTASRRAFVAADTD